MIPSEATGHVRSWLKQPPVELLDPGSGHVAAVLKLLEDLGPAGNLVTDAQPIPINNQAPGETATAVESADHFSRAM